MFGFVVRWCSRWGYVPSKVLENSIACEPLPPYLEHHLFVHTPRCSLGEEAKKEAGERVKPQIDFVLTIRDNLLSLISAAILISTRSAAPKAGLILPNRIIRPACFKKGEADVRFQNALRPFTSG